MFSAENRKLTTLQQTDRKVQLSCKHFAQECSFDDRVIVESRTAARLKVARGE
jgi:hypothetical protein